MWGSGIRNPGQPAEASASLDREVPDCWHAPDGEFPLLPAIEGGAGETTTNRRSQRNAGRQRSGSNRRDMGHSKTCSDLKARRRPMARRLTRGAGRRAAGRGRRRAGGGLYQNPAAAQRFFTSFRSNSKGDLIPTRTAAAVLSRVAPRQQPQRQSYEPTLGLTISATANSYRREALWRACRFLRLRPEQPKLPPRSFPGEERRRIYRRSIEESALAGSALLPRAAV